MLLLNRLAQFESGYSAAAQLHLQWQLRSYLPAVQYADFMNRQLNTCT
jgi:hypothetical protein